MRPHTAVKSGSEMDNPRRRERQKELQARLLRLKMRQRSEKGQQLLPEFKKELENALGTTVALDDFLSLAETQSLRGAFFEKVRGASDVHRTFWNTDRSEALWSAVGRASSGVEGMDAILFHHFNEYVGAVVVPVSNVLANPEQVWGVVEEDLCLCTSEISDGFCLELNHYGHKIADYEVTAWGIFAEVMR
jgi:hypothetical protein